MAGGSAYWPELQAFCRSFPDAVEEYPWNEVVYKVKGKVFVFTAGDRPEVVITVKPLPERRDWALQQPGVSVAQYVGRFGWVTLRMRDATAWELARELIAESYATVSKAKRRCSAPLPALFMRFLFLLEGPLAATLALLRLAAPLSFRSAMLAHEYGHRLTPSAAS